MMSFNDGAFDMPPQNDASFYSPLAVADAVPPGNDVNKENVTPVNSVSVSPTSVKQPDNDSIKRTATMLHHQFATEQELLFKQLAPVRATKKSHAAAMFFDLLALKTSNFVEMQ